MAASDLDADDRLVTLRGGVVVPVTAYVLALTLEARGFTLTRADDTLIVRPPERLTPEDCVAIRRAKLDLLAVVDYCARPDNGAHLFTDPQASTPATRHAQ